MENDHNELVDQLEQEADHIQQPSDELREDIKDQRDDWDRKTKTEAVPGAMPIDEDPVEEMENQANTFEYEERQAPSPPDSESSSDEADSDD
jgi:hypothetical protein